MPNEYFDIDEIGINMFVTTVIEKKLKAYKEHLYKKNGVLDLTWCYWSEINPKEFGDAEAYGDTVKQLYKMKYENNDVTADDETLLDKLLDILDSSAASPSNKLNQIQKQLKTEAELQDECKKKPDCVMKAFNEVFNKNRDVLYEKAWDDYAKQKHVSEIKVTMELLNFIAEKVMADILSSPDFIKQYLNIWKWNKYSVITKTANQVLKKYQDDKNLHDELFKIITSKSDSYVYSKQHDRFCFLDESVIGHTDSILGFVANAMGYQTYEDIPLKFYPKCDTWIKENILIKGANDENLSLGIFSG